MTNIELIKAGKLAIIPNDADVAVKCIRRIWPKSSNVTGKASIYGQDPEDANEWTNIKKDLMHLPTILATDLLKEIEQAEWKPKRGDLVEVSVGKEKWYKRIFLAEIEGVENPFFCVCESYENKFSKGELFNFAPWKHIRPIPTKHKVTKSELLAEYARANGIEVSQIEITD